MPTVAEVLEYRRKIFEKSSGLIAKKGHDYNRTQQDQDTLFNLRVARILGVVETDTEGIFVRVLDKIMRLISLTTKPSVEAKVDGEIVEDTLCDLHNYLDYAIMIWGEKSQKEKIG
jgi:hypothetical protein